MDATEILKYFEISGVRIPSVSFADSFPCAQGKPLVQRSSIKQDAPYGASLVGYSVLVQTSRTLDWRVLRSEKVSGRLLSSRRRADG